MKRAAIQDAWGHVRTRSDDATALTGLDLQGVPSFDDVRLEFSSPARLFVGSNGAGKTALLELIASCVDAEAVGFHPRRTPAHLNAGTVEVDLRHHGSAQRFSVALDGRAESAVTAEVPVQAFHLDASRAYPTQADIFGQVQELAHLTDPLEFRYLDEQALGYLVGRDYAEFGVFEVAADDLEEVGAHGGTGTPVLPLFYVSTTAGLSYDSRTMGAGEWAAAYILWGLTRGDARSFYCIEEPESFLSARSRKHLSDTLALAIDDRKYGFAVTTHSTALARPWDAAWSTVVTQLGTTSRLHATTNIGFLDSFLGTSERRADFVGVEDALGRLVLREILYLTRAACVWDIEILPLSGESVVSGWLKNQPSGSRGVAVFDGDQRGRQGGKRVAYLPGEHPPESVIRAWCLNHHEELASMTGREPDVVFSALSSAQGLDPHDWLTDTARELGFDHSHLFASRMVHLLFEHDDDFRAQATELANRLDELLK